MIVSYNSAHVLASAVASCPHPPVVVDNASTDTSVTVAEEAGARVIAAGGNVGFGTGCNIGARAGSAPFILFLNPDSVLTPGALERLEDAARAMPGTAAWAPRIVESDGTLFFRRRSFLLPRGARQPLPEGNVAVRVLSGAALLVRRTAFEAVGGFDEEIFLFYEDDDLCIRLGQAGWELWHIHDALVRHGRGQSSGGTAEGRRLRARLAAESQAHVAAKHGLAFRPGREIWRARWRRMVARLTGRADRVASLTGRIEGLGAVIAGGSAR